MGKVDYQKSGATIVITLSRPEKLNALDATMARALAQAWIDFQNDAEATVAVLTGEGRAFCAGIDVQDRQDRARRGQTGTALFDHDLPDLYLKTYEQGLPGVTKPVIVAANGLTTGIGFHLLIGADLRIASEDATFGLAEINIGIVGSNLRLAAQRLPLAVTMELVLTGDFISAQRAYEIGLLNSVVPRGDVLNEALAWADRLQRHPPKALEYNKLVTRKAATSLDGTIDRLLTLYNKELFDSQDHKEAVDAFLEKRKPHFHGR